MALSKVRVQLLNEETGAVIKEVDVLTSADAVTFSDGQTFQQKLDAGALKGAKGDTGAQGPKGDTGATGAQGSAGAKGVSMRLKGAWSSTVAYVNDGSYIDLVTSGGNTYACKVSNTNVAVTDTNKWELIASKGATGAQGAKGDTGNQGVQGPKGDKGDTGAKGADGDSVKVGSSYASGTPVKLLSSHGN
ncbi:MAG: hypothetical protein E6Y39_00605 [Clostridium butyricum]|nr:hypothetical protein [Clostridium butyricum]